MSTPVPLRRTKIRRPRVFEIVQFGIGGVGRNLLDLIVENGPRLRDELGLDLRYRSIVGSRSVLHLSSDQAATSGHIRHIAAGLKQGEPFDAQEGLVGKPSNITI